MAMNFALVRRPRPRPRATVQRRRRRRFRAGRGGRNRRTGGFEGLELKFKDFELQEEAFTTSWAAKNVTTANCLGPVDQGSGPSNRLGRRIWAEGIYIRGEVRLLTQKAQTNASSAHVVRLCLVLDSQTNKAEVVPGNVMKTTVTNDYLTFRNLELQTRFKVLWDRTFVLTPTAMNEGAVNSFAHGEVRRTFKIMKKFRTPLVMDFESTATPPTVGQMTTNSFSIIGISTSTNINLNYVGRLRFRG